MEVCLRIAPRKTSNHIEASQWIYIVNWRTGLQMIWSFTGGNPRTDCEFNRTDKISKEPVKKVNIIIKKG